MKIRGANDMTHFKQQGGYRAFIQAQVKQIWGDDAPVVDWKHPQGDIQAFIIRSNWVAECPCGDTSVVQPGDLFFCQVCAMQFNDHKPMTLVMPERRAEIETLLSARPFPQNRNWLPSETVDDLQRENDENGH